MTAISIIWFADKWVEKVSLCEANRKYESIFKFYSQQILTIIGNSYMCRNTCTRVRAVQITYLRDPSHGSLI